MPDGITAATFIISLRHGSACRLPITGRWENGAGRVPDRMSDAGNLRQHIEQELCNPLRRLPASVVQPALQKGAESGTVEPENVFQRLIVGAAILFQQAGMADVPDGFPQCGESAVYRFFCSVIQIYTEKFLVCPHVLEQPDQVVFRQGKGAGGVLVVEEPADIFHIFDSGFPDQIRDVEIVVIKGGAVNADRLAELGDCDFLRRLILTERQERFFKFSLGFLKTLVILFVHEESLSFINATLVVKMMVEGAVYQKYNIFRLKQQRMG